MSSSRRGVTRVVPGVAMMLAMTAALTSCTSGDPRSEPSSSSPASVALGVQTVSGGDGLAAQTRTEVETAVGDVLSTYISRAYLGDFPRRDFVQAFESFTSGAARLAAQDIDELTAAPVQDASAVRATLLDSRLSLLVVDEEVLGATATVRFAFEATMRDGDTRPVSLRGRFLLDQEQGEWSVFGYDLAADDGGDVAGGTS